MSRLRLMLSSAAICAAIVLSLSDIAETRPTPRAAQRQQRRAQPQQKKAPVVRKAVAPTKVATVGTRAAQNTAAPATSAATKEPTAAESTGERAVPKVHLISIDGSINPATADFIREAIGNALREDAALLIIELDTPGGLLESAKTIVKDLLGAPLPVAVYVAPSGAGATSAGVFVTMAASVAVMAPGTNIGAAHPVGGGGEDIKGDMREKVENFTASLSRSIASERGRNVEWAEKAVRESLSITAEDAVKENVVDFIATSREDMLKQLHGRDVRVGQTTVRLDLTGATVITQEMRFKQKLLNILANPNVAYLLMMAGLLGLYVEFTNPGVLFPGVAGGICLLLALAALQVLPINYTGLGLIALGIALLISELFVPSFGTLGVGGLIAFVLGSLLLFDTPDSDLTVDPNIVYAAAATFAGFSLVISYLVVRTYQTKPSLGPDGLIGKVGEVRQPVSREHNGKVFVYGEYWNATAAVPIEVGERVEVTKVDGLCLTVRPLSNPAPWAA